MKSSWLMIANNPEHLEAKNYFLPLFTINFRFILNVQRVEGPPEFKKVAFYGEKGLKKYTNSLCSLQLLKE